MRLNEHKFVSKYIKNKKNHYQGKTTDEDHGYHSRFKVFVFNQPESLDAKIAPALPKWRVWITGNAGKFEVTAFGTTVGRVVVHHQLLRGGLQYLSLHSKKHQKVFDKLPLLESNT